MASRIQPVPLGDRGALWNLVLIWVVIVVGLLAAIGCVGYILNESLISYSTCSGRDVDPCTDAGWFSSMGLTFFGGFAAVITGGAIGIRRHYRASGVWYPLAGLGGALLLTAAAVVVLKAATKT
ncbi:hypothetical protein [Curtobacterium sp. MCLR17_034]|uniref:hypothetical protein n=1 Tax=Curtobacterium sp. MCLR17_034 TaxID=2175623 RepID=UPI000DA72398|nr:hypothetical protein [Curtobacterium sp. MCLR17_034]PZF11311.1 hypothetical protein DEI98_07935 [Curtobacterium sp. MCLR17_034]